MQSLIKNFYHHTLLSANPHLKRALPVLGSKTLHTLPRRNFGEIEVQREKGQEQNIEVQRQKLGIDMQFNEQKHAYILTFPWNFQEIIQEFENEYKPLANSSYWHRFVFNTGAVFQFNKLYREFHQYCALPEFRALSLICEPKFFNYVRESVDRIQFHGLDIEMANLTVEQPSIKILKVETYYGLKIDRSKNNQLSEYQVHKKKLFGQPFNYYIPKNDKRSFLDHLDYDYKPYTVAVTALIESPMKMFVQNQNYSSVLFGSKDQENVKNVVRFETNVRWLDFTKIMPLHNKYPNQWFITDFNNVLNENPFFENNRF